MKWSKYRNNIILFAITKCCCFNFGAICVSIWKGIDLHPYNVPAKSEKIGQIIFLLSFWQDQMSELTFSLPSQWSTALVLGRSVSKFTSKIWKDHYYTFRITVFTRPNVFYNCCFLPLLPHNCCLLHCRGTSWLTLITLVYSDFGANNVWTVLY